MITVDFLPGVTHGKNEIILTGRSVRRMPATQTLQVICEHITGEQNGRKASVRHTLCGRETDDQVNSEYE